MEPSLQQAPASQGPLTDDQLKAMCAEAQAVPSPKAQGYRPLITTENLDEIFTFHKWIPEQIERGNAIRAAAKELASALLHVDSSIQVFAKTIRESAIPAPENPTDLYRYAQDRRDKAFHRANSILFPQVTQEAISGINEIVMLANSAITFEAAQLVRDNPPPEVAQA